jgi:hypothetical protein
MGLVKRVGGSQIPPGERLRFRIETAVEDEGDHGPQVKLELKVLGGKHSGAELLDWCKVAVDDESEEQYIADGGKLFNVAVAVFGGDVDAIDGFESIAALAEALEGKTFVSITKPRGADGKYTGITWDMVYTDPDAGAEDPNEEDFDDIPF